MAANPIITMISQAYRWLGTPYVFGSQNPPGSAGGPGGAFDCSGLYATLARKAGVSLIHQAKQQATQLRPLTRRQLRPGDAVFFSYGRLGSEIDHVGMYIGGGRMIDTSNPESDLKITNVDWDHFVQGGDIYRAIGAGAKVPSAERLNNLAVQYGSDRYVDHSTGRAAGNERRQFKNGFNSPNYLAHVLKTYGLNPKAFDDMIHQAVIQGWSLEEFEARIYATREFRQTFPGIFNKDGSLKMTPGEYQQLIYGPEGYKDMAREMGVKFDRDRFGALIGGNVSPSEWAYKLGVAEKARATEPYRQAFNAQLRQNGGKDLNPSEWARFIEGKSNSFVESVFLGASLDAAEGLDFGSKLAGRTAKQITKLAGDAAAVGEIDPQELVQSLLQQKDVIGPELRQAGITDADLALVAAGYDPRNLTGTLTQIARNRTALGAGGSFSPGTRRPGSLG